MAEAEIEHEEENENQAEMEQEAKLKQNHLVFSETFHTLQEECGHILDINNMLKPQKLFDKIEEYERRFPKSKDKDITKRLKIQSLGDYVITAFNNYVTAVRYFEDQMEEMIKGFHCRYKEYKQHALNLYGFEPRPKVCNEDFEPMYDGFKKARHITNLFKDLFKVSEPSKENESIKDYKEKIGKCEELLKYAIKKLEQRFAMYQFNIRVHCLPHVKKEMITPENQEYLGLKSQPQPQQQRQEHRSSAVTSAINY